MKDKTAEENNLLLKQLQEKLGDATNGQLLFQNNIYLYMWLQRNQKNVDRTEKAIRKSIEWRKSVNLDELVEREWAFFAPGLEYEAYLYFDGFSKTGLPVTTSRSENVDGRAVYKKYGKENILRYMIQAFAKLERHIVNHYKKVFLPEAQTVKVSSTTNEDSNGQNLNHFLEYDPSWDTISTIHVSNLKDFTLKNSTFIDGIKILLEGAKLGIKYFPTVKGTLYLVDLNKYAGWFLKRLKPIIANDLFTLEVYDNNESKWSKELLKHIDAHQLQTHFGGMQLVFLGSRK